MNDFLNRLIWAGVDGALQPQNHLPRVPMVVVDTAILLVGIFLGYLAR